MTLTSSSVPNAACASIGHEVNVVCPRLVPSFGALPVAATFGGALIFSPVSVNSMGDPGVTYDRVFKVDLIRTQLCRGQMIFMVRSI